MFFVGKNNFAVSAASLTIFKEIMGNHMTQLEKLYIKIN